MKPGLEISFKEINDEYELEIEASEDKEVQDIMYAIAYLVINCIDALAGFMEVDIDEAFKQTNEVLNKAFSEYKTNNKKVH